MTKFYHWRSNSEAFLKIKTETICFNYSISRLCREEVSNSEFQHSNQEPLFNIEIRQWHYWKSFRIENDEHFMHRGASFLLLSHFPPQSQQSNLPILLTSTFVRALFILDFLFLYQTSCMYYLPQFKKDDYKCFQISKKDRSPFIPKSFSF